MRDGMDSFRRGREGGGQPFIGGVRGGAHRARPKGRNTAAAAAERSDVRSSVAGAAMSAHAIHGCVMKPRKPMNATYPSGSRTVSAP